VKSLQAYDEYGASEDPLQLQAQVRELKAQLENQTKLIRQMQSLLRRNSLSGDLVAGVSDPSVIKEHEGAHKLGHSQERSPSMKGNTSRPNIDAEKDRTLKKILGEQPQQTRSRSTSPARSSFF